MNLLHLMWAFFVANALGYGGGPASIPLMQDQVVHGFHWVTNSQFANILALGNALPGPISTNVATYVGYLVAGWPGVLAALVATIVPSAAAFVGLRSLLARHSRSGLVRGMTELVQPVITVMMLLLTLQMSRTAISGVGVWQFVGIGGLSLFAMIRWRLHPAFLILGAFAYGAFVMPLASG